MLKTCFGLGSLRGGVNVIAVFNMILFLWYSYDQCDFLWFLFTTNLPDLFADWHHENNELNADVYARWDKDCRVKRLIYFIFTVLILISNVCLKQSTFKRSLHKIYAWLVINYAAFLFLASRWIGYSLLLRKYKSYEVLYTISPDVVCFYNILPILIFGFEIFVVHSYYIAENRAILNDVIQLKWKYVSIGKVLSQGTDNPGTSTFQEMPSRETSNKSPFVNKVFLDKHATG